MGIRDLLWDYPIGVSSFVRRFSLLFVILAGAVIALLFITTLMESIGGHQAKLLFRNTLRYGVVGQFVAINPIEVGASEPEQVLAKLLYNSLIANDGSGRFYPELAETWGISPDGKEYTFYLRKGVKWHDGYEFTAKDVATTFELMKSGDTETTFGSLAKEVEVSVQGLYKVAFTLKQVNATFLELLLTPILPDHLYANLSYSRVVELGDSISSVGTGPYRLDRQDGQVLILKANQQYFKGTAKIPEIVIEVFPTYSLAEKAFLGGEVHAISPIEVRDISRLERVAKTSSRVVIQPIVEANNTRMLLFNVQKASTYLGKNLVIRQAVMKSIDREQLVSLFPGSELAFGPLSKTSLMYSPTVETITGLSMNDANSLLEKDGWHYPYSGASYRTKGDIELKITLTYLDTETNSEIAQNLRKQLLAEGINLLFNKVSEDVLLQQVLPQKEFELLLFEIHTGVDPDQYGLWHSSQTNFPALNLSEYNSSEVDTLLERGRLQTNLDKRTEIYKQFQERLTTDAVAIFLYHPAFYEVYFDIIDRKVPLTVSSSTDRFTGVNTWTLMPGWRNWQTR